MFIKKLSDREKSILFLTAILGAAALGYHLVLRPIAEYCNKLDADIDSKTALLVKDMRLLEISKALKTEYEKYPIFTETLKTDEEKLAETLVEIEEISKKSSCNILNIKPRHAKSLRGYKEIAIDISVEGSLIEFLKFLRDIENSKKILKVRQFTITPKSGAPGRLKGTFLISKIALQP